MMGVSDNGTAQQGQSTGQKPFPLNRVVAFLGPYVAIVSGALATWLIEHMPGLHVDKATLASNITAAIVFLIGAAGTFAMHHKWLSGWQEWEKSLTDVAKVAAALEASGKVASNTTSVDGSATLTVNGGAPPPTVDPGSGGSGDPGNQAGDQGNQARVLPNAEQELLSIPDDGASVSPFPQAAVKPDPVIDELAPAEM